MPGAAGCAIRRSSKQDHIQASSLRVSLSEIGNHRREERHGPGLQAGRPGEVEHPQGETYGKVKKRLTSSTEVGGQKVNASDDDPRYLVESEKSGNEAAHKPDSLSKA